MAIESDRSSPFVSPLSRIFRRFPCRCHRHAARCDRIWMSAGRTSSALRAHAASFVILVLRRKCAYRRIPDCRIDTDPGRPDSDVPRALERSSSGCRHHQPEFRHTPPALSQHARAKLGSRSTALIHKTARLIDITERTPAPIRRQSEHHRIVSIQIPSLDGPRSASLASCAIRRPSRSAFRQ